MNAELEKLWNFFLASLIFLALGNSFVGKVYK